MWSKFQLVMSDFTFPSPFWASTSTVQISGGNTIHGRRKECDAFVVWLVQLLFPKELWKKKEFNMSSVKMLENKIILKSTKQYLLVLLCVSQDNCMVQDLVPISAKGTCFLPAWDAVNHRPGDLPDYTTMHSCHQKQQIAGSQDYNQTCRICQNTFLFYRWFKFQTRIRISKLEP